VPRYDAGIAPARGSSGVRTKAMTDIPITNGHSTSRDILGHPAGLYICFATEMWERFSFYGMKFLLLLYLTKYHLFTDHMGLDVLGSYAAMVYAMPVIGGLVADRYLGMRKAVTFGGSLLVLGHLGMAVEGRAAYVAADGSVVRDEMALSVFYLSISLIVIGVGFLKPNISTIVGRLYAPDDPRRDGGFTIFYMGINLGAFTATLLCGWLGENLGWGYGFGAAGIGMVLGLASFHWGQKFLEGQAEPPAPAALRERVAPGLDRERFIYLCALLAVAAVWWLVQSHRVVHIALNGLAVAVVAGLSWFLVARCNAVERGRMLVLMVLTFSTVVFWALFEQAAASMTLYADRVVDREILGFEVSAAQFGSLNPFFIITLAPLFAWLWTALARRRLEPSTPVKFSLGIIQAGLGFGALVLGASFPDQAGKVSLMWLVLAYLLHTTGELSLSPLGLSAVTKLSVPRVVGLMMGAWFLATAYSEYLAAQLAKLGSVEAPAGGEIDIAHALAAYTELFQALFVAGVGAGLLLLLCSPLLRKAMHGIH